VAGVWAGKGKPYKLDLGFPLPLPDREKTLRYRGSYHYIFHRNCAIVKTSSGCSHRCGFCFCARITRGRRYERPLAEVVEEIAGLEERNVFIVDDDFLSNDGRVRRFCSMVLDRKLDKKFILFGRADFIDRNAGTMGLLKQAGLTAVFVGLESAREEELRGYGKRTTVAMNERAVGVLESLGLECYGGIITGPDWAAGDFTGLASWLNQFRQPIVNIQPLTPMPGTPAWKMWENRLAVSRTQWAKWDMAHLVLKPGRMSVRRYYGEILRAYYRTMAGFRGHWYVLRRYGPGVYARVFKGVVVITLQYLKLMAWGRL
jgi:radical SAM superfamily enzyme YgiQ (UPF0313 family)